MDYKGFIHLRLHSAYSLAEGAIHVKNLSALCAENNMPAVAVTDTNNMFGMLEASIALPDEGIQPIIGLTLGIRHHNKNDSRGASFTEPAFIVLLAQTSKGYENLMSLTSQSHIKTEGGETPQVLLSDLQGRSEDVICLTGGVGGVVGRYLLDGDLDAAENSFKELQQIFADRLYMEIMRHDTEDENRTEEKFIDLAYKYDVPLVATNHVFFAHKDMYLAHDALLCIAAGAYVEQDDRRRINPEYYFKSSEEMNELFADLPEAILNTVIIAQRCAFKVPTIAPILPKSTIDETMSEEDNLKSLAKKGLAGRLEQHVFQGEKDSELRQEIAKPYEERLDYELGIINDMGFPGYFLIVADFIKWSKDMDIPVGPGRGSGAGSVVAWVLLITDLDPLRFGLLFERFLNPERVSMPDFDIDFCQDRREEVIRYVQEKYGHDQVAQIITFGKLQARAVLRDVGRVLQMPYGQIDRLSKMIPNNPASPMTLSEALDFEIKLRQERERDENIDRLITLSLQLEGLFRHASTHAAGVVIGDRPLQQLVPLYRDPRSDMPVTQFNMKFVEQAGLVKFDFLGLKTLTVLQKAMKHIELRDVSIDLEQLPLDDAASYEMLSKGQTVGVFQLESTGMQSVLVNLKPDKFEDIIAVVALYRPGPMDNIPRYIACKHGEKIPDYLDPMLKGILTETYGVIIYQEQVMQIAQVLANYSLGEADLLRRAMGKKIQAEMDVQRIRFNEGAKENGVPYKKSNSIFDQVNKFAGYGFNKSHAAAYALVSYHTAYLKSNYTVEFMAGIMSLDLNNTDKLQLFKQELNDLNVPILPPCINHSEVEFSAEIIANETDPNKSGGFMSDNILRGVRYALAGLKNVGSSAMQSLVDERNKNGKFKDLSDFCARIDVKMVNKRAIESLAKAGGFDCLNPDRAQIHAAVELILKQASAATEQRNSNQTSLFGDVVDEPKIILREVKSWGLIDGLKKEQEAVGFYLSAHPLDAYKKTLEQQKIIPSAQIREHIKSSGEKSIRLAGTIQKMRKNKTKRGKLYAFLSLSDAYGSFEVMIFSEILDKAEELFNSGSSVVIVTDVKFGDDDSLRLTGQGIEDINDVAARSAAGLDIYMTDSKNITAVKQIIEECKEGKGRITFKMTVDDKGKSGEEDAVKTEVEIELKQRYMISPMIRSALITMAGVQNVKEI